MPANIQPIIQPASTSLVLRFGGYSAQGCRKENQDAFVAKHPDLRADQEWKGSLVCIADGVSCSQHGQRASHTSVMQFVSDYYATPASWGVERSVGEVLRSLNSWLFSQAELSENNTLHNGLVTTFSGIVFKSNTAHIFHVGDTRVYLLRNNELRLLTRDHQRINFGKAAYLTRALGMDTKLEVDYQSLTLKEGDQFILTTDGVHDTLSSQTLLEHFYELNPNAELESEAKAICQQALDSDSQDNVTTLLVSIDKLPPPTLMEFQQQLVNCTIPPVLKVNNRIDGFVVTKVLYSGSRSHVYEVIEQTSQVRYVLKAPSLQYQDDTETLVYFCNEYWVGSHINNHRVMKLYPRPAGSPYLYHLCEPIKGITLRQWMYDNPSPAIDAVRVLLGEMVKAVRVLQRLDMVHRDLKPENIMITSSGSVKLIDFGSVKIMGLAEGGEHQVDDFPLGAANYIAPEYLSGKEATTISDLFSIAVMGFEMLTGKLPYKEVSTQSISQARHQKWHYRSALQFREDIPQWLDLTFKKACHPSSAQRYQVMSEFIADLSTPNHQLVKEVNNRSLIEVQPILFWKGCTLFFVIIAAIELLLLLE
ncbi:serine/threonine protein kinase [Vibrio sp. 10N.286.49.B3]|nr:serine/threonine protein kinase [Vibrio sp. 10N.286.49.B3]